MAQLTPIELEDGTIIYIEATENVTAPSVEASISDQEEEVTRGDQQKGWKKALSHPQERAVQNFQAIEGTIRAYTNYTLSAFKKVASANVDKVTLEFGIKISGEAGVSYVTKGTAESNLKITVECSFPNSTANKV